MNLLIDTNIALYLLAGDQKLIELLDNAALHMSFISELELLAYPEISEKEQQGIRHFINECLIVDINEPIKEQAISIHRRASLTMSDAIVAASAITEQLPLLSADKDFERVSDLYLLFYEV